MKYFSILLYSYLNQVRAGLYRACPIVSALRYGHVTHQQVCGQVTGSERPVGGLQQGQTGHTAGTALLLTHHQSVRVQTPARVQVKIQH